MSTSRIRKANGVCILKILVRLCCVDLKTSPSSEWCFHLKESRLFKEWKWCSQRLIESMMGLRPRQVNLRLISGIFKSYARHKN